MRLTHSARLAALLAPILFANPLATQIPGGLRTTPRAQAPGNGTTIVVWPRHLQTLQARLDSFAVSLPAEERALWNGVLLRAVHAPTPAAAEIRVTPVLEIGPGGGCEDSPGMTEAASRVAIIVQGGRTAGATGIVVQGGRTSAGARPSAPTEAVSIGPRQDDPARPAPESLGRRLADFSLRLSAEERGALNWLLTRAAEVPEARPGTQGGLPPGVQALDGFWWPPLPKALGIDPRAIGRKPEDPGRGRTEERWILRF